MPKMNDDGNALPLDPLYTHDQHQMVVIHARSGMLAIADRTAIECAREDEVRSGFTTSFLSIADATSNLRDPNAFPRGEQVDRPSPEAARWREAVLSTLDAYAAMPFGDRYSVNLQRLWSPSTRHPGTSGLAQMRARRTRVANRQRKGGCR